MNLCVIGAGHVGLVTAACLAEAGHTVICVDSDASKLEKLSRNEMPFYEPGLAELVTKAVRRGKLAFTGGIEEAVRRSEVVFVAVGTPAGKDGRADLSFVENVSVQVAKALNGYKVVAEKSTVPVRTGERIKLTLSRNAPPGAGFDVASNPEFLREGTAVRDFMRPDRIVIGVESEKAGRVMKKVYEPLGARTLVTDIKSAEIIKHASNSFLAMKISYINAVSRICELAGADVEEVARGMGMDKRIGPDFLEAGIGYGGSCLPKDVSAFIAISQELGYDFDLLKSVERINTAQRGMLLEKLRGGLGGLEGRTIGVLGLSFKPGTDDIRESPAIRLAEEMLAEGAGLRVYDPAAAENARGALAGPVFCEDAYEAASGSDALVILTEWEEFKRIDMAKLKGSMARPLVVDGRNLYDPAGMKRLGFEYKCIGRP